MTESEYKDLKVEFPIEPHGTEAVHIDSPSTCHPEKCLNCDNRQKRDKMPSEARYYGYIT